MDNSNQKRLVRLQMVKLINSREQSKSRAISSQLLVIMDKQITNQRPYTILLLQISTTLSKRRKIKQLYQSSFKCNKILFARGLRLKKPEELTTLSQIELSIIDKNLQSQYLQQHQQLKQQIKKSQTNNLILGTNQSTW